MPSHGDMELDVLHRSENRPRCGIAVVVLGGDHDERRGGVELCGDGWAEPRSAGWPCRGHPQRSPTYQAFLDWWHGYAARGLHPRQARQHPARGDRLAARPSTARPWTADGGPSICVAGDLRTGDCEAAMISCLVTYTIDAAQVESFERFAREWIRSSSPPTGSGMSPGASCATSAPSCGPCWSRCVPRQWSRPEGAPRDSHP